MTKRQVKRFVKRGFVTKRGILGDDLQPKILEKEREKDQKNVVTGAEML